ncbi:thermonuclease family protein [Vulcanococcus limneticus Candia 3F8]|nr:thermonuclease family protein [Vulcanococcus limneticus MW73D5]MCP9894795.1 thermonuclease family protein [Vulcanococcus limneticus Candia 3F8]MCP9898283.1 thermonuclease family protein [Vulcanococcus limneticus Candia 3B3]
MLLTALLVVSSPVTSAALPLGGAATVVSIGDGDTIRVRESGRLVTVRLACIDAPEMAQAPYGAQARLYLQTRLPTGSDVRLIPQTTDRYGRTVAEVIGGVNLNLALVEDGLAFAYRQYLSGCNAREYLDAEYRASRRRYGVWQVPGGLTRPWDFRRSRRTTKPAGAGAAGSSSQKPSPWATSTPLAPTGATNTTTGGRRYRCREIGSYAQAQQLLRQGHTYLDGDGDGEACESLRR